MENQNATLLGLYNGRSIWCDMTVRQFREQLRMETEDQLLERKYYYNKRSKGSRVITTVNKTMDQAAEQIQKYIDCARHGKTEGATNGITDGGVITQPSERGDELVGYTLMCIGATRVIARRIRSDPTRFKFTYQQKRS